MYIDKFDFNEAYAYRQNFPGGPPTLPPMGGYQQPGYPQEGYPQAGFQAGEPYGEPEGILQGGFLPGGPQVGFPPGGPQGGPPSPPQGPPRPPQGRPPTGRPPSFTPAKIQAHISPFAVDSGSIRPCLFRYVYIWPERGRSFWAYPIFVGRNSLAGWRWTGFNWVYFGMDLRRIETFICY